MSLMRRGCSPFLLACQMGHDEVVKYLLALEDVNVNRHSLSGMDALHFACIGGHYELAKSLIQGSLF